MKHQTSTFLNHYGPASVFVMSLQGLKEHRVSRPCQWVRAKGQMKLKTSENYNIWIANGSRSPMLVIQVLASFWLFRFCALQRIF